MTTTTVATPSLTLPDNHYDDPLAPTSFKAMWTALPAFPSDDGHSSDFARWQSPAQAPSSPNDNYDGSYPHPANDNSP